MQVPEIFISLISADNGYELKISCGDKLTPLRKYVYHSLSEAMREINNSLSGIEMGCVYRAPKSLDFDESEKNIENTVKRLC
jgi:hypothetical protein